MFAVRDGFCLRATALFARRGARVLFERLDVALASGEALALVGPNGVGKSTLLRILAFLGRPDAGTVAVEGAEADTEPRSFMHYGGHRDGLTPALTVAENLIFVVDLLNGARAAIPVALDRVGAGTLADLPVRVLSAGQRRRVALARLIAVPRPIWLLDEPTAALDDAGQRMVAELIAGHLRGGGCAVVATHQPITGLARTLRLGNIA